MKIEIDIPIEELDYESDYDDRDEGDHVDVLIEMITDKAASLLVQQIDYDYRISLEKSLENKINNIEKCLETRITERVSKDSYKPICDKITETVSEKIAQRYDRSQQYRDIKKQFEIENDSNISMGMKALISDIVRSEVKKIIKLWFKNTVLFKGGDDTKQKFDGMLLATFITTLFYSATYPYIHKEIMQNVSDTIIALNQIINCLSIVILGSLWNKKSDKLFKYYPMLCVSETILGVSSTIWAILTHNILAYYIIDTLIFAIITRNICCGGVKLRAIRYKTETDREHFDNNNNSMSAIATIIGSMLAIILKLDFVAMLWLATIGNAVDNIFYIFIYRKTRESY